MYIPPGYGTMMPYIYVKDPLAFLDFVVKAFGAEEIGRTVHPRGSVVNLRVRLGTSNFMVAPLGGGLESMAGAYRLFVENVDGAIVKAITSGAVMQFAPVDMPYGDRQAAITDPCGNTWFLVTRLVHEPYDVPMK